MIAGRVGELQVSVAGQGEDGGAPGVEAEGEGASEEERGVG